MRYLVCTEHPPIHLTCRATWLAGALKRKGYEARAEEVAVVSPAPTAVVDRLLSYRPLRSDRSVFESCAASADALSGKLLTLRPPVY